MKNKTQSERNLLENALSPVNKHEVIEEIANSSLKSDSSVSASSSKSPMKQSITDDG